MAKNFYIIGHNPNSTEDAYEYLANGANAIEPDICFHKNREEKFYVHEDIEQIPDFIEDILKPDYISLKDYLLELKKMLRANPGLDLKLIAFDLKPPYEYDINELYQNIRENFSNEFPLIKILTTISDGDAMNFLAKLKSQNQNEAIGVDERAEPEEVHEYFKDSNLKYTYGAGSSFFSPVREKYVEQIQKALALREKEGFKMIHAWCVNEEEDMKVYLDMNPPIDAILTDEPQKLRELIKQEYSDKFTLNFDEEGKF